ncbi:MAG: L-seryl-tRNA(Sec) selenium transferase [Anaerolineae bacterium]|nr:L-seryl-tRNA(Sec) selenium transferase [Anaerolineae bacterium]
MPEKIRLSNVDDPELRAALRALTSVDRLMRMKPAQDLERVYGRTPTLKALRAALTDARAALVDGLKPDTTGLALINDARRRLRLRFVPTLQPTLNATGIVIHPHLGRAVLSEAAEKAIVEAASHYITLEYDLNEGRRASRLRHAEALLKEITGAEAALIVNNNAAAGLLALSALAKGREVIVSRGQLVEVSGGFNIPRLMRQCRAQLVEVGATNRTRIGDYERGITRQTAALMRVHNTNFRLVGAAEAAPLEQMARLAHGHGLWCFDDLGSGALLDTAALGLVHEPTVQESIAAEADLTWFSGDKLLGGPQCGILVGRSELIDKLRRHPLIRALRADKLTIAALTATLDHYRRGEANTHIPIWRIMSRRVPDLQRTVERWLLILKARVPDLNADITPTRSTVNGGVLMSETLPSVALAVQVNEPDSLLMRLRRLELPIIARIEEDKVLFDPRTVFEHQEQALIDGICAALVASDM